MRAAAPAHRVLAQARFEVETLLRNGEQLLVTFVLPALSLLAVRTMPQFAVQDADRLDVYAPLVFAVAVVSSAFTGQAISTGFDRRAGVLRYLGVSPLGRGGLLAGKLVATGVVITLQVTLLAGLAAWLGWRPDPAGLPSYLVTLLVGTACFVALALLLAGTVRAEATLGLANLLWVGLVGAIFLTTTMGSRLDGVLGAFARLLPSSALAWSFLHPAQAWQGWLVLLLCAGVAGLLTVRTFRWSP